MLIKISAVSYLNSKPFTYGIENSGYLSNYRLEQDIPSICAEKLLQNKVDIGLVPVAIIPMLRESYLLTDYCIGAVGPVSSVMLYSHVPLEKTTHIYLDYQSRTSVILARVLARYYWKINPEWINTREGFENHINDKSAAVVIGDRTFEMNGKYPYAFDLSEEWQKFTGLPFVFACWVANKKLPPEFLESFNKAIEFGITNIEDVIKHIRITTDNRINIKEYLTKYISYSFDDLKKEALNKFLMYAKTLNIS